MSENSLYTKTIGIMLHILLWVVFSFTFFSLQPLLSGSTVTLVLLITAFYFNAYVLVPQLLLKNRMVYYIVIIAVVIIAITSISRWADRLIDNLHLNKVSLYELTQAPGNGPDVLFGFRNIFTLITSGLVVGISTAITAIQKWQKDRQEREKLEKEKVTSELSFLKAQINPHFFFNTLNNIYALTVVDAGIAGKAIHQLSRMMRYLLYDTQQGNTMLSKELAFIKDYICLMQLRLTNAVTINVDMPAHPQDVPVAPMIFLPFVENAFKHGISATQQSNIDINILQQEKQISLTVKNTVIKNNNVSLDTNSGIGLVNTRRRLDLLYPGRYKLDINDTCIDQDFFIVHLVIDLS